MANTNRSGIKLRFSYAVWLLGLSMVMAMVSLFQSTLIVHYDLNQRVDILADSSRHLSTSVDKRQRAVFYNIFIPGGEHSEHALGIVQEQLALKQKSTYLKSAPLYYSLIGANVTFNIQKLCHQEGIPIQGCRQLQFKKEGDEGLTLQSLYNYCLDNPSAQVTYIHNKGSFHPSERNEKFRSFINRGVFSDKCQDMPTDQCNACASRFSAFPHFHFAGNFFTAQCSYMEHLLPPHKFVQQMEKLFGWNLLHPDKTIPRPTFQQYADEYPVGRQRFAYEHWAGSHPYLEPCDVYSRKYTHGYRDLPGPLNYWIPRLVPAPRFNMSVFLKISVLRGEWYCGQARLLEYEALYGLQPKPNHFLWDFYLETFKGCDVPLNRTQHQDIFASKVWLN